MNLKPKRIVLSLFLVGSFSGALVLLVPLHLVPVSSYSSADLMRCQLFWAADASHAGNRANSSLALVWCAAQAKSVSSKLTAGSSALVYLQA